MRAAVWFCTFNLAVILLVLPDSRTKLMYILFFKPRKKEKPSAALPLKPELPGYPIEIHYPALTVEFTFKVRDVSS